MQVVVTFLAILQLMKEGVIFIEQNQPFDEIMIHRKWKKYREENMAKLK